VKARAGMACHKSSSSASQHGPLSSWSNSKRRLETLAGKTTVTDHTRAGLANLQLNLALHVTLSYILRWC